jgi:ankyrin repeat domain-containing protein 17
MPRLYRALVGLTCVATVVCGACSSERERRVEGDAKRDMSATPRVDVAAQTNVDSGPPPLLRKPRPAIPPPMPRIESPPLNDAAFLGELAEVRELLRDGADVNARSSVGRTALMLALATVVDDPQPNPAGPAAQARARRKFQIARLLVESGADVTASCCQGRTALHEAIGALGSDGDIVPILELLIARGADVNQATADQHRTPLEYAVEYGTPKRIDVLLKHGARSDVTTFEGKSMLELAEVRGDAAVLALIRNAQKQSAARPAYP